ncbi:hypothetical protein CC85DRAFT_288121 [Cutaneotrichosporon oleaginosum]|uniref:Uncharacterized protein n=1 Tax=Cutaneotrichosporon oleaginosum TaxID=879819 RepID=A0A0J1AX20_9TREE|nr:uncharacterized protein CC85DRAFT_288121 [Cutaneotrichosporon oleaginosum]KLT39859.1 hypothetical protein CC85DRAFT_288121 [Cutaneotrichosporon oleaginosum]TXT05456.1 hypothetical protein COLE_06776 [Cutaneotrichosporon oleaginosum]
MEFNVARMERATVRETGAPALAGRPAPRRCIPRLPLPHSGFPPAPRSPPEKVLTPKQAPSFVSRA